MAGKKVNSSPKKVEAKVDTKVDENIEVKAEKEIAPVVQKKKFAQDDLILCRSVTVGDLWYDGPKSRTPYNWVNYGDVNEVEYRDLAASVRSRSPYVYAPYFVIEDDDFIAEFPQLEKFYTEQYTVDDLKGVLNLNVNDMVKTIQTLPKSAINSLKNIASTQVANGKLDSIKKIKALDEIFGTELNLLSSLVD